MIFGSINMDSIREAARSHFISRSDEYGKVSSYAAKGIRYNYSDPYGSQRPSAIGRVTYALTGYTSEDKRSFKYILLHSLMPGLGLIAERIDEQKTYYDQMLEYEHMQALSLSKLVHVTERYLLGGLYKIISLFKSEHTLLENIKRFLNRIVFPLVAISQGHKLFRINETAIGKSVSKYLGVDLQKHVLNIFSAYSPSVTLLSGIRSGKVGTAVKQVLKTSILSPEYSFLESFAEASKRSPVLSEIRKKLRKTILGQILEPQYAPNAVTAAGYSLLKNYMLLDPRMRMMYGLLTGSKFQIALASLVEKFPVLNKIFFALGVTSDLLKYTVTKVSNFVTKVKDSFKKTTESIKKAFTEQGLRGIANLIRTSFIQGITSFKTSLIQGLRSLKSFGIRTIRRLWSGIKNRITIPSNIPPEEVQAALNKIAAEAGIGTESNTSDIKDSTAKIEENISKISDFFSSLFSKGVDNFFTLLSKLPEAIDNGARKTAELLSFMKDKLLVGLDKLTEAISNLTNKLSSINFGDKFDSFKQTVSSIGEDLKKGFAEFKETVIQFGKDVKDSVTDFIKNYDFREKFGEFKNILVKTGKTLKSTVTFTRIGKMLAEGFLSRIPFLGDIAVELLGLKDERKKFIEEIKSIIKEGASESKSIFTNVSTEKSTDNTGTKPASLTEAQEKMKKEVPSSSDSTSENTLDTTVQDKSKKLFSKFFVKDKQEELKKEHIEDKDKELVIGGYKITSIKKSDLDKVKSYVFKKNLLQNNLPVTSTNENKMLDSSLHPEEDMKQKVEKESTRWILGVGKYKQDQSKINLSGIVSNKPGYGSVNPEYALTLKHKNMLDNVQSKNDQYSWIYKNDASKAILSGKKDIEQEKQETEEKRVAPVKPAISSEMEEYVNAILDTTENIENKLSQLLKTEKESKDIAEKQTKYIKEGTKSTVETTKTVGRIFKVLEFMRTLSLLKSFMNPLSLLGKAGSIVGKIPGLGKILTSGGKILGGVRSVAGKIAGSGVGRALGGVTRGAFNASLGKVGKIIKLGLVAGTLGYGLFKSASASETDKIDTNKKNSEQQQVPQTQPTTETLTDKLARTAEYGTEFGLTGAIVGSAVPVVGTAAGALMGGIAGTLYGFFKPQIDNVVSTTVSGIKSLFTSTHKVINKLDKTSTEVSKNHIKASERLKQTTQELQSNITLSSFLSNPVGTIGNFFSSATQKVTSFASNIYESGKQFISDTTTYLMNKAGKLTDEQKENATKINSALQALGYNETERLAALSYMGKESGLKTHAESFKYKSTSRLREVFGRLKSVPEEALQIMLSSGEERLAEALYGPPHSRLNPLRGTPYESYIPSITVAKDLGNTQEGDGYRFRGRGFIQLTGRANYARYSRLLYEHGFTKDPDLLIRNPDAVNDPTIAAMTAAVYLKDRKVNPNSTTDINSALSSINTAIAGKNHILRNDEIERTRFFYALLTKENVVKQSPTAVASKVEVNATPTTNTATVANKTQEVATTSYVTDKKASQPTQQSTQQPKVETKVVKNEPPPQKVQNTSVDNKVLTTQQVARNTTVNYTNIAYTTNRRDIRG